MTWSFAQARQAAADVRAAPLGSRAVATMRPRGVVSLVRSRAPLSVLLFVAARDGLVTEQDNGGYAVLQRPSASPPVRSGGYQLRLLRWLDRRWDLVLFGGPPLLGLLTGALAAPFVATRLLGLVAAAAAALWVCVFLTGMLAWQLRWIARLGAGRGQRRAAESLAASHWSVRLVHQPDPDRIDDLMRLLSERLAGLVRADLQASAGDKARIGRVEVTETLVVLTDGISTQAARVLIADSLRAVPHYPAGGDVTVLASPGRLDRTPARPVEGGGFLLLYLTALALAIAVCARFVADAEARACTPASCTGRPVTYASALHFLLQRLLLTDPAGLSPGTTQAVVLGWLVSVAGVVLVAVAFVAARQEIARNRETYATYDEAITGVTEMARVLILVVTPGERDAVLGAVREHVGRDAVTDQAGERTIYTLGSVAGTELMLVQSSEQGIASAAGMFVTARDAIRYCRPDYVILTGICYGLRPDEGQQIGDVVVARRIQNLDHVKVTDDDGQPVIYRGVNVGSSPELLDRFQACQPTWSGARVHVGTVLTWNTLVNSERTVSRLRRDFPDAIAGEMEGAGVYEAATLDDKPDWIMVKAISDWGYRKTDGDQQLAARNAAGFVVHVIAGGAFRRRFRPENR